MFAKQIQDAVAFFGPESLNVKKLKHRFSSLTGNDFDTWFISEQELQQKQQAAAAQGADPNAPAAPGAPKGKAPANLSIAGAAQGKTPTLAPIMK